MSEICGMGCFALIFGHRGKNVAKIPTLMGREAMIFSSVPNFDFKHS